MTMFMICLYANLHASYISTNFSHIPDQVQQPSAKANSLKEERERKSHRCLQLHLQSQSTYNKAFKLLITIPTDHTIKPRKLPDDT